MGILNNFVYTELYITLFFVIFQYFFKKNSYFIQKNQNNFVKFAFFDK